MSFCTSVKSTVSGLCNIGEIEPPQDDNQPLQCSSNLVHMILSLLNGIIGQNYKGQAIQEDLPIPVNPISYSFNWGWRHETEIYFFYSDYACVLSSFSCAWLLTAPWTKAHQAWLSMGFSRQEYWSGLPCPPPGDLPNPRIKPTPLFLLHWQAGSLPPGRHSKYTRIKWNKAGGGSCQCIW